MANDKPENEQQSQRIAELETLLAAAEARGQEKDAEIGRLNIAYQNAAARADAMSDRLRRAEEANRESAKEKAVLTAANAEQAETIDQQGDHLAAAAGRQAISDSRIQHVETTVTRLQIALATAATVAAVREATRPKRRQPIKRARSTSTRRLSF